MRTFHIGGAAQKGTEISNIESKYDGVIKYSNLNITKDSAQNLINMSRNSSLSVIDNNNKERARHRLPFGCKLKFQDNQKIKSLDVLAEWDPFTLTYYRSNKWVYCIQGFRGGNYYKGDC